MLLKKTQTLAGKTPRTSLSNLNFELQLFSNFTPVFLSENWLCLVCGLGGDFQ